MFLQNTTIGTDINISHWAYQKSLPHAPLVPVCPPLTQDPKRQGYKGSGRGGESHTSSSFCLPAKFWLGPDAHSNDGKTNLKHWICRKELGSKELTELLVQISKNIAGWPYCTWPSGHVQTFFSRLPIRLENTSTHRPAQAKIPKYLGEQHWRGWWFLPYFILMCQMM